MWRIFRKYHYLNHELNKTARCFVGMIENKLVAFMAVLHFPHNKIQNIKKVHRLVVLPDFQGIGIGGRMLNFIGQIYKTQNCRFTITTSNPALLHFFRENQNWKMLNLRRQAPHKGCLQDRKFNEQCNRLVTSWEMI